MTVLDPSDWCLLAAITMLFAICRFRRPLVEKRPSFRFSVTSLSNAFHFHAVWHVNSYHIYILQGVAYASRSETAASTHRLTDAHLGNYICWKHSITTPDEARAVALLWSRCTVAYVRTGVWPQDNV